MWGERIAAVEKGGIEALADATMGRWFSPKFRETDEFIAWRNMLVRTPAQGYMGCSHAIAGTDFYATTATLRLPTLGIAGSEDGSTPPDLVRETVELVPGSQFHLIRGAGHLPCVESPEEFARVLSQFIAAQAH
jgi:3-oxoadipate enol-lactonase